jgi:hypothetical protein
VLIQTSEIHKLYNPKIESKLDRTQRALVIDQCIRLLSAEILRLIRLPYSSQAKRDQIMYLDSLLAAYEKDYKANE